jgi:asparagine synthase (glutamine-hydrolysing)
MFKVDYLYNEGLPNWLGSLDVPLGMLTNIEMLGVHRYLPFRAWFRRELAAYVSQVLTDPSTARLPYWRKEGLPQIVADHTAGRCNYVREINAVLTINAAERLLLDSQQN